MNEFFREAVIYFILFIGSFGVVRFLASKLTAHNVPRNLRGHTSRSITRATVMLVVLFVFAALLAFLI